MCSRKRGVDGVQDGAHGVLDFAAALQDHGVAGLDRKRADLGDGIGACLEDDGEYAEWHADFFERQAVGEKRALEDAAGGVWQLLYGAHAFDHDAKFLCGKQQALKEGLRKFAACGPAVRQRRRPRRWRRESRRRSLRARRQSLRAPRPSRRWAAWRARGWRPWRSCAISSTGLATAVFIG